MRHPCSPWTGECVRLGVTGRYVRAWTGERPHHRPSVCASESLDGTCARGQARGPHHRPNRRQRRRICAQICGSGGGGGVPGGGGGGHAVAEVRREEPARRAVANSLDMARNSATGRHGDNLSPATGRHEGSPPAQTSTGTDKSTQTQSAETCLGACSDFDRTVRHPSV